MRNEIRAVLDAVAGSWIPRVAFAAFLVGILATVLIGITQNVYAWSGNIPPAGIRTIDAGRMGMVVGTSGTATAFLVTLYVAERNYRKGRINIPHLTMHLETSRVAVSETYDAIIVILNATNTGSGLCEVNEVHWAIQVLSPYDDETAREMIEESGDKEVPDQETEFPWNEIGEGRTPLIMVIEPGETEQMTYDFIIPHEIDAIMVSAWVSNASEPKTTDGWYRRMPHIRSES